MLETLVAILAHYAQHGRDGTLPRRQHGADHQQFRVLKDPL
jgi:hypothetical protein